MSKEPDWVKVLKALYDGRLVVSNRGEGVKHELMEYLSNHPDLTHLKQEELGDLLKDLHRVGLVEAYGANGGGLTDNDVDEHWGGLKPEGFQTVHERELRERQDTTNQMLMVATIGLFFAALVQATAAVYSVPTQERGAMLLPLGVIVLLVTAFYLISRKHPSFS